MGWLSQEVERTIASWINANNLDTVMDRPDFTLAEDAMRWKRSTLDGDQLTVLLSLRELCDRIEGSPEHVLYILAGEWRLVHPLSCRMRGLIHCTVPNDPGLDPTFMKEGTYALRDGEWIDTEYDVSPS
jgi:hypothetical protein